MEWECSGFIRNEAGCVVLLWTCSNCGCEIKAGMEQPECNCPECGTKNNKR